MNGQQVRARGTHRRTGLPRPIRTLVRHVPHVPSAAVVATALNLLLQRALPAETLAILGERPFVIEVRDLDLVMAFRRAGRRFIPVPPVENPALRFRLNAANFAVLAAPPDDPDTRFLPDVTVVGDPAIAVQVRRTLDAIDVKRVRRLLWRAARRLGV
jgi:O2-independent ubiquinone biosynthesis accessory factor UbiT